MDIVEIIGRGVPNQERLHIRVSADTDLSFYAVISTWLSTGSLLLAPGVQAGSKECFWFPRQAVKAGDRVFLFTGSGNPTSSPGTLIVGGTNYFFYWGRPSTLWGDQQSRVVLLEIQEWATGPQESGTGPLGLFVQR